MPIFITRKCLGRLSLSSGLRMSTQGQGDGGVLAATLSPAAYELGSAKYEENIS